MPTEREQDEADESMEESAKPSRSTTAKTDESDEAHASAPDDDADDDEDEEPVDDGRILTQPGEGEAEQAQPRNRSERRAQKKRDLKPAREDRNAKAAERLVPGAAAAAAAAPKVRVPPRRTSGKSNATDDDTPEWAKGATKWLTDHSGIVSLGVLVAVLGTAGGAGWSFWNERTLAKAASAYAAAMQTAVAPIRAADAPAEPANSPPHHGPTFTDRAARSQASLTAFRGVEEHYPNTAIARFAKLSEASTLYDLGRYADARRLYESLLGQDMAGEEGRVLEGLGFALEALHEYPTAIQRYRDLAHIQDGAWRDIAEYHQARVEQLQGHNDRAKDLLHGVIERARHSMTTDERSASAGTGSIREQAESLLRDIDPTDAMAQAPRGATPNFDRDALMRALMQQAQQRAHTPGGTPAAPGGGIIPVPVPAAPANAPAGGGH